MVTYLVPQGLKWMFFNFFLQTKYIANEFTFYLVKESFKLCQRSDFPDDCHLIAVVQSIKKEIQK